MDRKEYITPTLTTYLVTTHTFVMGSQLDPNEDSQEITPTDEDYDGEFQSRRRSAWEDEQEEEDF